MPSDTPAGTEKKFIVRLQQCSGLGELIDYDFSGMGLDRLYQVSDQLWKHRKALEAHCYQQELSLFQMDETVTLYDLTNTFFEGAPKKIRKPSVAAPKKNAPIVRW